MMSNDAKADAAQYLEDVLGDQTFSDDDQELKDLRACRAEVEELLREKFSEGSPTIRYGGSKAKGTMVKVAYDLDLICYFECDSESAGCSLKAIYESVEAALAKQYYLDRKTSALRILGSREHGDPMDFHIDVVPGRYVDDSKGDAYLYQSSGEKQRLKTNLETHLSHVRDSGVRSAIRLLKVWKIRSGLSVKNFALELLAIKVLNEHRSSELPDQLVAFWTELRDNADGLRVEDPANPKGNDLSALLDEATRSDLKRTASSALSWAESDQWSQIFGNVTAASACGSTASHEIVRLGDASHAQQPAWPVVEVARVRVDAHVYSNDRRAQLGGLNSDGRALPGNVSIRFRASVGRLSGLYTVQWQVVNTGRAAYDARNLRGGFYEGEEGTVHWESTLYPGKHWVECFILQGSRCVARSGRFYVNIRRA